MIILVIGGSSSGKSEYAENLTLKFKGDKFYIATMISYDEECKMKIEKHQDMRKDKGFETIECYRNIDELEIKTDVILLECIGNLLANEMYNCEEEIRKINFVDKVMNGILHLKNNSENLIIVSNDIFCDDIKLYENSKDYIGNLAEINSKIAEISDVVMELVFSIPIKIGGLDDGFL